MENYRNAFTANHTEDLVVTHRVVIHRGEMVVTGTGTKHTCDSIMAFCQASNTRLVCFNSLLQPIALWCPIRALAAPAIAAAFRGGAVWRRWYRRRGRLETAVWALAVTWGWARCRAWRADVSYHTPWGKKENAAYSDITSRHATLPCEPRHDPAPPDPAITCSWARSFPSLPPACSSPFVFEGWPPSLPRPLLSSYQPPLTKVKLKQQTQRTEQQTELQDRAVGRGHREAQGGFPWPPSEQSSSGATSKARLLQCCGAGMQTS